MASSQQPLNWKRSDISTERSLAPINWTALQDYAIAVKARRRMLLATDRDEGGIGITCRLSEEYNMGGLHLVRRVDFGDGESWVVRVQLQSTTEESRQRLRNEVCAMGVVRERSRVRVPEVFAYEEDGGGVGVGAGVGFMLMEYVHADTAMDSFGGWHVHKGITPARFKDGFYAEMARIQVEMAAVRFSRIGSVIRLSDGTYAVGPIPGIGGPFDSAAGFLEAWARGMKFPFKESTIRERTPAEYVDEILKSIKDFPVELIDFAQRYAFQEGPFPIVHTDLYKSNVLVDSEYRVQSVIDWENAMVVPWEVVEFIKDLSIVPSVMDGPLYREDESVRERFADRRRYIEVVKKVEEELKLDSKLSGVFGDRDIQDLASAIWLYSDGRIGFYSSVLKPFE